MGEPLKRSVRRLLVDMSFILVPSQGEDLKVNAWNWRPTLELLLALNTITEKEHEQMGANGCGGKVDGEKASRIGGVVYEKLKDMKPKERLRANLSVTDEPKKLTVFSPGMNANEVDVNELYSASFEWLETFAKFCETSGGFEVL